MPSFRRRPAVEADAQAIADLVVALDTELLGASDYSLTELEQEWLGVAPEDRWVVMDGDELVGYGTVEVTPSHGHTDGYVHPRWLGRGIGTLLVRELEEEVRGRGRERIQNAVLVADTRAQELLRANGYEEIRRFWHMRIELDEEPPAPVWPDGVTATSFDVADAAAFHEAYEEAFADHWQHVAEPYGKWRAERLDRPDFSPELWTVVRSGDEIVAGTVCVPERMDVAWISRLFTRRDWRRRGLGEALLHDAFGKFWRSGKHRIGLGVDAQSDTGAQRLYERAGMHVHWGAVVFEKTL